MRAVLDVNVLIAGVLAPKGSSASLIRRWLDGEYELVVSQGLLAELARALSYPKIRARVAAAQATDLISLLRATASVRPDRQSPKRWSRDPGDDYLIALAESTASLLVTGDQDLLRLSTSLPVLTPAEFLSRLGRRDRRG